MLLYGSPLVTVGFVDWIKDGGDKRSLSSCSSNTDALAAADEIDDDTMLPSFFSWSRSSAILNS